MRPFVSPFLAVALLAAPSRTFAEAPVEIRAVRAPVASVQLDDGKQIDLRLDDVSPHFELLADAKTRARVLSALNEAVETGEAVEIRYAARSGRIFDDTAHFSVVAVLRGGRAVAEAEPRDGDADLDPVTQSWLLGQARHAAGAYDEARNAYDLALTQVDDAQDVAAVRIARARASRDQGEMTRAYASAEYDALLVSAVEDYEQYLRRHPDDGDVVSELAWVLTNLGAFAEAEAVAEHLVTKMGEPDGGWMLTRGYARLELGKYDEALRDIERYREATGGAGMAYRYHRAGVLLRMGRPKDAAEEMAAGVERQPSYPWGRLRYACALGRLGRVKDAVAQLEAATEGFDEVLRNEPYATVAREAAAETTTVARELRRSIRKPAPTEAACRIGSFHEKPRSRSPLLPDRPFAVPTVRQES